MSKITKALTALMVTLSMLVPMVVVPVYAESTRYSYDDGVYTWDLKGLQQDEELNPAGYTDASFQSGTYYTFHSLTISSGNVTDATISDNGIKMKTKNKANIVYTPIKDGKLEITLSAPADAEIYVDADKVGGKKNLVIKTTEKVTSYTASVEFTLTKGSTYYIYDASSQETYIEKLVFTEEKKYTYENGVHTWNIIGLNDELENFNADTFKTTDSDTYTYNSLSIKGGNGAAFEKDGLKVPKNNGSIKYTPEKTGSLQITVLGNSGVGSSSTVKVSASGKDDQTITVSEKNLVEESVNLDAGVEYTISSSAGSWYLQKLVYTEQAAPEPAEDPTVTINYEDETLSTTTAMEYSTDGGLTWNDCEADMSATAFGWDGSAAVTVKFRTAESGSVLASEGNTEVVIPTRPTAPSGITASAPETAEGKGALNGLTVDTHEYKMSTETEYTTAAAETVEAEPGATYNVRVKQSGNAFAGADANIQIPTFGSTLTEVTGTLGTGVSNVKLRPEGGNEDGSGDISGNKEGTTVTFSVQAGTYTIIPEAAVDYKNATSNPTSITVPDITSFTTSADPLADVSVTIETVPSDVGGITVTDGTTPITSTTENAYKEGKTVTASAAEADGYSSVLEYKVDSGAYQTYTEGIELTGDPIAFKVTYTKTNYAVTKGSETNGTFTITGADSLTAVPWGTELTITPSPSGGYETGSITVTKTGGTETVDVANNKFIMPKYGVTVNVSFNEVQTAPEPASHYSYENGLHTWNFVGMNTEINDPENYDETKFDSNNATYSATEPMTYKFNGLVMKGGKEAKFVKDKGLKLYKNGAVISYTPAKDGTLTMTLVSISANAEIYAATSSSTPSSANKEAGTIYKKYDAKTDEDKIENIRLTGGITYYIFNLASGEIDLKEMTFQEDAGEKYSYDEATHTHTWTIKGLSGTGYINSFDAETFASDSKPTYQYPGPDGITICGNGVKSIFTEDGLYFHKNGGYIKYTAKKNGTLKVKIPKADKADGHLYVETSKSTSGKTAKYTTTGSESGTYAIAELEAGTYFIWNDSSSAAYYVDEISFEESDEIVLPPSATPTTLPSATPTTLPSATPTITPAPSATTAPSPEVNPSDGHYTYADGVHTWNFVNFNKDAETLINGYNKDTFASDTPKSYDYQGLSIESRGNVAAIEANGLKTYVDKGVYIKYTPTKNGTLAVSIYATSTGAAICVGTDPSNAKEAQKLYTTTADDSKVVIDIEQTAELTAGTTYYIWNSANKTAHIQKLVFTESGQTEPLPSASTEPSPTTSAEPETTAEPSPTTSTEPGTTAEPSPTTSAEPEETTAPTETTEPEETPDPSDTHYTYENGVRTWDFVNFDKDAPTLLKGYSKDTFGTDTPKFYRYNGLNIESRGDVAAIDPTGLKTYVDKGVYIEYTPTKNGTLAVSIYATSTGAAICVGTDPSKADEATKLYTTTADDSKKVIDLEQTVELTAGTTYYIWNSANKTAHIQKLVFTEEGQATPEPTTEPTASPTAKPEETPAATSAPAETAKPSGSHYSYINNTHTWDFIGLEGELTGFDGEIFKTVENTHYDFNNLSIYGKAANGNTTNTAFDTNGLISDKGGGYIVYTPSKDGTLEITIQANVNSELYVDEGAAYTKSKTKLYKKADTAGVLTESVRLEAGKTYYIYNGSGTAYRLRKLAYTEDGEASEPTATPKAGETPSPSVTAPPATESPDKPAAYIKSGDTQTWNLISFKSVLEGFADSAFAGGASYDYEGLTLNGGTGAALSDNGILIKKLSGGDSVANTVAYTPSKNGTLTVTADTAAVKAEVYVGTKVDKGKSTRIIYSETQKGILTGTINLTAGNTYYIFSGASVDVSIRQVVFKENADSPVVTPTPQNPAVTPNPDMTFDFTDEDKLSVSDSSEGGVYEYSTNTRYPVDITSARSGVRTIASGLGLTSASQHVAFEMTLNTLLKENTVVSGAPDTFALEFTSGSTRVGGMLVAKKQDKVVGKDAVLLDWRTGSWANKLTKPVVVGEKYTWDFVINTTKDGDTETLDTIDVYVYDKDGKLYDYAAGLSRRNATAIQMIYLMAQPRTVGETDSVTIENIRTFYSKPTSTLLEIAKGKSKEKLSTDTVYAITSDKFNDTEWEFKKPYSLLVDGSTASYMTTAIELKKDDGSSLPQGITYDSSGRKIKASSGLEAGEYSLKATVISSYNGKEVLREDYPITLTRPSVTPQDVMNDYSPTVEYNGSELAADTVVTDNINLPESNSVVALRWNSSNTAVISNTGVVTRPMDDTEVTLDVEIASVEDPTQTKTETITVKVQGVRSMLEDAIADAKAAIVSADDDRQMDSAALLDLHEDIKLTDKYKDKSFTGYEDVTYEWKSDSQCLKVLEETAEIWPEAAVKYDANLTITAKYKNQQLSEVIPVVVNLTKDNAADKYAVRGDGNAAVNFSSIEGYVGKTVSGDISLPTQGIFGSTISWSSSAPMYMTNTGKYSAPSYNTSLTLSAVISKGSVMSDKEKSFKMTLLGTSPVSNSGGGGGGGSSSRSSTTFSGTASTIGGNRNTNVPAQSGSTPQTADSEPSGRFDDLGTVAWAEEAINTLADKGIISGRGDRIFAPNDDITRAEFATIIVNAFDLIDENAECDGLSDVTGDAWYYRYIASAYNNGIISGYDDGRFGVNDKITRQDMAVIIYRAMNSLGVEIEEVEGEIIFSDSDSISDYAKAAVTALQKADIVNGVGDDEFAPLATATRAQAAVIIYNTQK